MPRRLIDLQGVPLLEIGSYARRGLGRRDHLSPAAVEQIARTVGRSPEVMVKVLSRGGQGLGAISRHFDYLRLREEGELGVETDDSQVLTGRDVAKELIDDWNLELEAHRRRPDLTAGNPGSSKLVHKLLFSMPAGTPPGKVLLAVKNLAREEFALKHRYALVLHTDEPHPHVHVVIKAVSEQGERLHIRKAPLRHWRSEFARHLRALGVAANATERAVRGEKQPPKLDGIYRAEERGESRRTRERAEEVASELLKGELRVEPGKATLLETRQHVERGWSAISDMLGAEGKLKLAAQVRRFAAQMPPPLTEREVIATALQSHLYNIQPQKNRAPNQSLVR